MSSASTPSAGQAVASDSCRRRHPQQLRWEDACRRVEAALAAVKAHYQPRQGKPHHYLHVVADGGGHRGEELKARLKRAIDEAEREERAWREAEEAAAAAAAGNDSAAATNIEQAGRDDDGQKGQEDGKKDEPTEGRMWEWA